MGERVKINIHLHICIMYIQRHRYIPMLKNNTHSYIHNSVYEKNFKSTLSWIFPVQISNNYYFYKTCKTKFHHFRWEKQLLAKNHASIIIYCFPRFWYAFESVRDKRETGNTHSENEISFDTECKEKGLKSERGLRKKRGKRGLKFFIFYSLIFMYYKYVKIINSPTGKYVGSRNEHVKPNATCDHHEKIQGPTTRATLENIHMSKSN